MPPRRLAVRKREKLLTPKHAARVLGMSTIELSNRIALGEYSTLRMVRVPVHDEPQPLPASAEALFRARCRQILALPPEISGTCRLLLIALAEYENYASGMMWVSQDQLIQLTGTSASTIGRAIDDLKQSGLIAIVRRRRRPTETESGSSAVYRFAGVLGKAEDGLNRQNDRSTANLTGQNDLSTECSDAVAEPDRNLTGQNDLSILYVDRPVKMTGEIRASFALDDMCEEST
jgi:hypothetical protein